MYFGESNVNLSWNPQGEEEKVVGLKIPASEEGSLSDRSTITIELPDRTKSSCLSANSVKPVKSRMSGMHQNVKKENMNNM